jgi:hypothetical protein
MSGAIRYALLVAACVWLLPRPAAAHLTVEQNLELGPLPQGSTVVFGPLDARAARLAARFAGATPCPGTFGEIAVTDLPAELTSADGAVIPLSWSATSARIWQTTDPGHYVEFNPANQIGQFAADGFPATVGIGTGVEIPDQAPVGTYTASFRVEFGWQMLTGEGCLPRTFDRWITISVEVQNRLVVTADLEVIDLGILIPGMTVDVLADGSGPYDPAPFTVSGPQSLDFRLGVATRNLEHESEADELPLLFIGGRYGRGVPPDVDFVSGDVVPSADHEGGPLHIRCGYRVIVPEGVAEGRYHGEIVLSVEVLLN